MAVNGFASERCRRWRHRISWQIGNEHRLREVMRAPKPRHQPDKPVMPVFVPWKEAIMASDAAFVEFLVDQMSDAGRIASRPTLCSASPKRIAVGKKAVRTRLSDHFIEPEPISSNRRV